MKVHIVVQDRPEEQGGLEIVSAHSLPLGAWRKIQKLKKEDEYASQYATTVVLELED